VRLGLPHGEIIDPPLRARRGGLPANRNSAAVDGANKSSNVAANSPVDQERLVRRSSCWWLIVDRQVSVALLAVFVDDLHRDDVLRPPVHGARGAGKRDMISLQDVVGQTLGEGQGRLTRLLDVGIHGRGGTSGADSDASPGGCVWRFSGAPRLSTGGPGSSGSRGGSARGLVDAVSSGACCGGSKVTLRANNRPRWSSVDSTVTWSPALKSEALISLESS